MNESKPAIAPRHLQHLSIIAAGACEAQNGSGLSLVFAGGGGEPHPSSADPGPRHSDGETRQTSDVTPV